MIRSGSGTGSGTVTGTESNQETYFDWHGFFNSSSIPILDSVSELQKWYGLVLGSDTIMGSVSVSGTVWDSDHT